MDHVIFYFTSYGIIASTYHLYHTLVYLSDKFYQNSENSEKIESEEVESNYEPESEPDDKNDPDYVEPSTLKMKLRKRKKC